MINLTRDKSEEPPERPDDYSWPYGMPVKSPSRNLLKAINRNWNSISEYCESLPTLVPRYVQHQTQTSLSHSLKQLNLATFWLESKLFCSHQIWHITFAFTQFVYIGDADTSVLVSTESCCRHTYNEEFLILIQSMLHDLPPIPFYFNGKLASLYVYLKVWQNTAKQTSQKWSVFKSVCLDSPTTYFSICLFWVIIEVQLWP